MNKATVKKFEKKLLKCFRMYESNVGQEDFKMTDFDYIVLDTLMKCIPGYKTEEYLIIMYSYYKIEDFYFSTDIFETKRCVNMVFNTDIPNVLDKFIK